MKKNNNSQVTPNYQPTERLGVLNNLKDQYISLNTKKATYFGVKKEKANTWTIWLSPNAPYAIVPSDLSFEETQQITKALSNGIILPGKVNVPIVDQDKAVKTKYVNLIKKANTLDTITKRQFVELVKKSKEGGYTSAEILMEALSAERSTRSRPEFIKFLEEGLSHCTGPVSLVQDSTDEETDEQALIRKANDPDYQKPVNITPALPLEGNKGSRTKALNRFLS